MARVPDLPCADCGKLLWRGRTSLPAGEATCRECRRARPGYRVKDKRARGYVDRWTCAECGVGCERPATKGQHPKYCETCRRVRRNPLITLPHSTRLAIYERDGWKCGLCSADVDRALIGSHSPWRPSLDHIIPRSSGGSHDPSNLRLAHVWCNSVRGAGRADDLFEEVSCPTSRPSPPVTTSRP